MQQYNFSVVIPTYNRANTVCRTIESVLSQTLEYIQIIIVDDGSNDNTRQVLEKYINSGKIEYFYIENGGVQVARNFGLERVKSEYVLFLDSDDTILPTFLQKAYSTYSLDNNLVAVYCQTGLVQPDNSIKLARKDYLQGFCYKEVLEQGYLTSTSFITMRTNIVKDIGGWDIDFPASQDDDICFRLAKTGKIKLLDEILGIYYTDGGNKIGDSASRVAKGWWILWNKYKDDIVIYCGKDICIQKFEECLYRFTRNKDKDMQKSCLCVLADLSEKSEFKRIRRGYLKMRYICTPPLAQYLFNILRKIFMVFKKQ